MDFVRKLYEYNETPASAKEKKTVKKNLAVFREALERNGLECAPVSNPDGELSAFLDTERGQRLHLYFAFDAHPDTVTFYSVLEVSFADVDKGALARALMRINADFEVGAFVYVEENGYVMYRAVFYMGGNVFDKDVADYLLYSLCFRVDGYSGILLGLADGSISVDEVDDYIRALSGDGEDEDGEDGDFS